jgi:hypothetical protein
MAYDKGSRVVAMIEDRLGETAFLDFMHRLFERYRYRILRVADFRRELEAYTGYSWEEFFRDWLYGPGITDWAVEKVVTEAPAHCREAGWLARLHRKKCRAPGASPDEDPERRAAWKVTVVVRQKGKISEQTSVGFALPGCEGYPVRVPIIPQAQHYRVDYPPAEVFVEDGDVVRVEVYLPDEPTQVAVDPDQVLIDKDPINNFWKTPVRWRLTPLYTFLEETDLTNAYDRWNVIIGPWIYAAAYNEVWYPRSTMVGGRAGLYRTQEFDGGAYTAYRTDFRDVVAGVDALWSHWPDGPFQVGFNAERRLTIFEDGDKDAFRAVVFGRYIFQYTSSLYLQPMNYLEAFAAYQDNFLPFPVNPVPEGERYTRTTTGGLHYRLNYLTPYWDPEGGFLLDLLYEGGVADLQKWQGMHKFSAQFSTVKYLPDLSEHLSGMPTVYGAMRPFLLYLADTRVAVRGYGATGLPTRGEFFTMGGGALLRGFDLADRQGSTVWVGSVEWRLPLAKGLTWDCVDHIFGLRNIYSALFYDIGDAYTSGHSNGPVAHSIGAGLRLDVSWFGFVERTMLRLDVARAVNTDTPTQVWFGIQHPF